MKQETTSGRNTGYWRQRRKAILLFQNPIDKRKNIVMSALHRQADHRSNIEDLRILSLHLRRNLYVLIWNQEGGGCKGIGNVVAIAAVVTAQ